MGWVCSRARRGYVHADVHWDFHWGQTGGVVAGLVAEGDGKSYGADGGVVVGYEAQLQGYAAGIDVETFIGGEGKFFDAAWRVERVEKLESSGEFRRESGGDQVLVGGVMRIHVVAVGDFGYDGYLKFFAARDGRERDKSAGFYNCGGGGDIGGALGRRLSWRAAQNRRLRTSETICKKRLVA